MKNIFIAFLCLTGFAGSSAAATHSNQLPFYIAEFVAKMGIDPMDIKDIKTYNIDINEAAKKVGYNNIERTARAAIDDYTKYPFFEIRKVPTGIVIEKHYTLTSEYKSLKLYLTVDQDGRFISATYAEGLGI